LTDAAPKRGYRIAMLSDFFYPNVGGVEQHLYQLSQCLIARGNKVIIVTHSYNNRKGVRYLTNGLKVYYLPQKEFYNQSSFPTIVLSMLFPLVRKILIREQIEIVHCHQGFSCIALEGLFIARTMGYRTCFTDHSVFGFADAISIHMNKVLKFSLSDVSHAICVSHTGKENTVLRASLDPLDVSVIPNALDGPRFVPDPSQRTPNRITIVVVSRLVYRKGMDLLVEVIPEICELYPNVDFLIGGDGNKRVDIEDMREKYQLHDRVTLLGNVPHHEVRNVLVRGDIFLNCSLTEAFCIAIVEAACCGLMVVSTSVGGVPEVLPPSYIVLAEPDAGDLIDKIREAVRRLPSVDPWKMHEEVKHCYDWNNVAERTEKVYDRIIREEPWPLLERLRRHYGCGPWAGKLFCMIVVLGFFVWQFLEWISPREEIEIAPDFPFEEWRRIKDKYKDRENFKIYHKK
jgi:phosphatidylinositol glycan class A protein